MAAERSTAAVRVLPCGAWQRGSRLHRPEHLTADLHRIARGGLAEAGLRGLEEEVGEGHAQRMPPRPDATAMGARLRATRTGMLSHPGSRSSPLPVAGLRQGERIFLIGVPREAIADVPLGGFQRFLAARAAPPWRHACGRL